MSPRLWGPAYPSLANAAKQADAGHVILSAELNVVMQIDILAQLDERDTPIYRGSQKSQEKGLGKESEAELSTN